MANKYIKATWNSVVFQTLWQTIVLISNKVKQAVRVLKIS
jgi:hypothetical protein